MQIWKRPFVLKKDFNTDHVGVAQVCRIGIIPEYTYLWFNNNGGIQTFFRAFWIGLQGIKGNILIFLGMPFFIATVKKGPVGFQNMVNSILKALDKTGTIAFKKHVTHGKTPIYF